MATTYPVKLNQPSPYRVLEHLLWKHVPQDSQPNFHAV
ncbi:Hypothetical protein PROPJV5_0045 [Propionibacterium ruminifibrarum]|uniref:Uncharacterized protein n=1 Tax=Propionibacterium ruminifibrarum TaxID=1962131 RepID=A0A375HXP7_9ACTN|nr:Hypothetical protein PROPJV5_0045 [Propionibacterium ruminifibrarum]